MLAQVGAKFDSPRASSVVGEQVAYSLLCSFIRNLLPVTM